MVGQRDTTSAEAEWGGLNAGGGEPELSGLDQAPACDAVMGYGLLREGRLQDVASRGSHVRWGGACA